MFLRFIGKTEDAPIIVNSDHIVAVQDGVILTVNGKITVKNDTDDIMQKLAYADRKERKQ